MVSTILSGAARYWRGWHVLLCSVLLGQLASLLDTFSALFIKLLSMQAECQFPILQYVITYTGICFIAGVAHYLSRKSKAPPSSVFKPQQQPRFQFLPSSVLVTSSSTVASPSDLLIKQRSFQSSIDMDQIPSAAATSPWSSPVKCAAARAGFRPVSSAEMRGSRSWQPAPLGQLNSSKIATGTAVCTEPEPRDSYPARCPYSKKRNEHRDDTLQQDQSPVAGSCADDAADDDSVTLICNTTEQPSSAIELSCANKHGLPSRQSAFQYHHQQSRKYSPIYPPESYIYSSRLSTISTSLPADKGSFSSIPTDSKLHYDVCSLSSTASPAPAISYSSYSPIRSSSKGPPRQLCNTTPDDSLTANSFRSVFYRSSESEDNADDEHLYDNEDDDDHMCSSFDGCCSAAFSASIAQRNDTASFRFCQIEAPHDNSTTVSGRGCFDTCSSTKEAAHDAASGALALSGDQYTLRPVDIRGNGSPKPTLEQPQGGQQERFRDGCAEQTTLKEDTAAKACSSAVSEKDRRLKEAVHTSQDSNKKYNQLTSQISSQSLDTLATHCSSMKIGLETSNNGIAPSESAECASSRLWVLFAVGSPAFYVLLAFLDLQGGTLMVIAFNHANLASTCLIDWITLITAFVLSVKFMGERVTRYRILALVLGLAGSLCIFLSDAANGSEPFVSPARHSSTSTSKAPVVTTALTRTEGVFLSTATDNNRFLSSSIFDYLLPGYAWKSEDRAVNIVLDVNCSTSTTAALRGFFNPDVIPSSVYDDENMLLEVSSSSALPLINKTHSHLRVLQEVRGDDASDSARQNANPGDAKLSARNSVAGREHDSENVFHSKNHIKKEETPLSATVNRTFSLIENGPLVERPARKIGGGVSPVARLSRTDELYGDVLCVLSAFFLGVVTVMLEKAVATGIPLPEILLKTFGPALVIGLVEFLVFEFNSVNLLLSFNLVEWIYFFSAALTMTAVYCLAPIVLERSSSAFFNLSLLSSAGISVLLSTLLLGDTFPALYSIGLVAILSSLIIYYQEKH